MTRITPKGYRNLRRDYLRLAKEGRINNDPRLRHAAREAMANLRHFHWFYLFGPVTEY